MWKEVESRKADKAGIEKTRGEGRKERNKETNNRRRKNNSKNKRRKREERGRFDRVKGDRRNSSKTVS